MRFRRRIPSEIEIILVATRRCQDVVWTFIDSVEELAYDRYGQYIELGLRRRKDV
jgi:hypothetical protein